MKIVIMRHGEAEMLANSDRERPLTPRGQQQATAQGLLLKQLAMFDKVLVSPYVRAQETFQHINQAYDGQLGDKMETWSGITPNGHAEIVVDYLTVLSEQNIQSVLLISHLPLVGDIVGTLGLKYLVKFYPATFAEIEWEQQLGKLLQSRDAF